MSILKFLTQDELDDLDEDPRNAFLELVNLAERRLDELKEQSSTSNGRATASVTDLEYSFMTAILASAKQLNVEPICNMGLPRLLGFGSNEIRQFHADLDHCVTQITLDNRIRARRESVAIPLQSKDRIRTQLSGLRRCIEQADMTEAKREALLQRLDEFEKELEKRRLNITVVALFACTILGIPGSVWASGEVVQKLTTTIMQAVADAKVAEDETRRLPPTAPPKAILPPRV